MLQQLQLHLVAVLLTLAGFLPAAFFPSARQYAAAPAPIAAAVPTSADLLAMTGESYERGATSTGDASWYGSVLDGHTTASGRIFHKNQLTAAHRTLPFGTLVRVVDLRTRRSVIVKITDRGELFPQRIIDLSSGAARELGILRSGVAHVRLEVLLRRGQGGPQMPGLRTELASNMHPAIAVPTN